MNENDILNRVEKLERENKFDRILIILLSVFLIAGFYSNDTSKIIKTEKLELVDSLGTARAQLKMEMGNPAFYMMDENGKERLALVHDDEQTALYILDKDGTVRIGTAQFAHGGGGYALHGANAKGAAVLYLKDNGSLTFYDKEGKIDYKIPKK